jgi:WD40 repeat protein
MRPSKFNPTDPGQLVTGSLDNTIKLWQTGDASRLSLDQHQCRSFKLYLRTYKK